MKAKEYYILIKDSIEAGTATGLKRAVDEMFCGMNREVRELQEKRNVRFDRGLFPIIKEEIRHSCKQSSKIRQISPQSIPV